MDHINIGLRSYTIILFISTLSFIASSNINCNGKAFHCVNSTHFKICVDLGGGVSTTVDEFLIKCPQNTVCKQDNIFECEYELTTTLPPLTIQSEVTNEQFKTSEGSVGEQLDVTTLFPTKQRQGMELSEKYYDKVNATPASVSASYLTDAVINPVTSSNINDLHTSSNRDINTTLDIPRSTDKELTFSTTESEIRITKTSPYNMNTLVRDNGVSNNYNSEIPLLLSTIQDRRTTNSIKSESLEPLNQNSSDLDGRLTTTKRPKQVSRLSELPFSVTVTLLTGNFSDQSLQDNAPQISNIIRLIKSDIITQERNPDILIKYNTSQLNYSDNNTQYRNINSSMYSTNTSNGINTLNSTIHNVFRNEAFSSNVTNINELSKIDSLVTPELPGQHLAEITTPSNMIAPGITNHFSSHISLNTAEAIETFLNDGLNITTNLEKLSVTDNIIRSTSIIPETSVVKTNEMSQQITNFGLNYGVSNVALDNPSLDENSTTSSNRPQISDTKSSKLTNDNETLDLKNKFEVNFTSELHDVNISQYSTTTEPYFFHERSNTPILLTSNSEITSPTNISEVLYLSSMVATQVHNASQIDNAITIEIGSTNTDLPNDTDHNFNFFNELMSTKNPKNHSRVDILPVLTTAEMSNSVTSVKPLSDLISENVTWPKQVTVLNDTNFDNNNVPTAKANNNLTAGMSTRVTSSKPLSDLISKNETWPESFMTTVPTDLDNKNETWPKLLMTTVATNLDNNNITTTKTSNNITAEISTRVTSSKPLSDLISKNETWPEPFMTTVATDLDNNNITTIKASNNITAEISYGFTSSKPLSDLLSKNETWHELFMTTVATDHDNKNITTTKTINNITPEISTRVTSLKPLSDLISKNETWPEPFMTTVATDLDNNNITTIKASNNITAEISYGFTSSKPLSDLLSKNETWHELFMTTVATDHDNKNITTTKTINNITPEISTRVTSLKPLSDLISKDETWPEPFMTTVPTDLDNKNETWPKLLMTTVATNLDNNNITTTKTSNNITAEISTRVTSSKPLSDLISKNETWPEPFMTTVATDLDNNNITTIKASNNITAEISYGFTSSKPLSDLLSKNETWHELFMTTVATDHDNKNITTTKTINNITPEISTRVTSLKPLSDLISKNETWPEPFMTTVATDLDNNNITTIKASNNITAEISYGFTSSKPLSDLLSKNETWHELFMTTVATDHDNKNITTSKTINNITPEISTRVTSLKPLSDLISKNETWPEPFMTTVATDLDNNNITTIKASNNITAEISPRVTNSKPLSDLISKNETRPKPIMTIVAIDLDNNNITTTKANKNIIAEISNGETISKPLSDLISKNETWPEPFMTTVATDLDNNNKTTIKASNNITAEISPQVTNSKPLSDLISKDETWPEPFMTTVPTDLDNKNETWPKLLMTTVATNLDNNNITTTKTSNNITAEISTRVTSSKPLSDLISKNETWPEPFMTTVATDLDNNNITTIKASNNITAEISYGFTSSKPLSDLLSKNETWHELFMTTVATDHDNKNITTTKTINNITPEISTRVTSLKPLSDLISKNETWPEPFMTTVATDLDNNNITTIKASNNITAEISYGFTSSKPLSDLLSKNETWHELFMTTVATDHDNKNITTSKTINNITPEISTRVTSLKPLSDLISKNETWPEPFMTTVATDLDNNNITTIKASNNITAEISPRVTNSKPLSDLISKNETRPKPIMTIVAIDLDNNNITTTKANKNIIAEISNGETISKPLSDLISKNETWPEPFMTTVATDLDNNNITTIKASNNITAEISPRVTNSKPLSDLISKNETRPKPIMTIVAIDLDNNNITTTKANKNIIAEISNGETISKPLSDLISKNETWPEPFMTTVATDLDNNNKTTIKASNNITAEISPQVTNSKPLSDLISKNETWLKPLVMTFATDLVNRNETRPKPIMTIVAIDLDNNNITTTKANKNIIAEISNGETISKPLSDLISKNETWPEPFMTTVATDHDNKNITTTKTIINITPEISTRVTSSKPLSDLISKNETWPEPFMTTVATDLDNKNETWSKLLMTTVATELDNNNITTIKTSNNITAEIFYGVTISEPLSDFILKNETWPKTFMTIVATDLDNNNTTLHSFHNENVFETIRTIFTDHESLNESTTNRSSFTKIPDYIFKTKHNKNTTHDNDATKPVMNSLYKINNVLSTNSILMNSTSEIYQPTTNSATVIVTAESLTGTAVFDSANSGDVTNSTFVAIDVLSEYRVISVNNKSLKNTSKLESTITTEPSTYFDLNTRSKHIFVSDTKTVTTLSSELANKDNNKKQIIYKNTSKNDKILGENTIGNQILTKLTIVDIVRPKLVTPNNFSLTVDLNVTNTNNKETDKSNRSFKNIEVKRNQDTNNLVEKSLILGVMKTDLNYTDKNLVSSVSSNSKTVPLTFLPSSLIKPPLADIYNVNHSYFCENISPTLTFNKSTASNKFHETENKESSQTNKNGLGLAHAISNIEHNGNNTEYPLLNPYKQVTTTVQRVNDTTLKELLYIIRNWTVVNTTLVADANKPSKTYERSVPEPKSVSIMRTKENFSNDLNATTESSITANIFLRNASSQISSIKSKTQHVISATAPKILRISSGFDNPSQSTGSVNISKMETTPLVSNKTILELISEQKRKTIYKQTNRSNGIEEKQLRNGHEYSESTFTIGNDGTKNIRNNTKQHQNSFTTPINNINYSDTGHANMRTNQEFSCTKRGKYSDTNDCNKFYVCIGRSKPIIGVCPTGTVFSEYLKQCTKNITHCIRNNQFKCTAAGRFINILLNNTYFICAKKKSSFIRFTLKCQRGFYLDKNIKCTPELINVSTSVENSSKNTKELSFDKSKEMGRVSANSKNYFECEKEGKFNDPQDCRKYYVCKKGRKSTFRRIIKICDSDEVFHKKKEKCVDVDSYECDT